MHNTAMLIFFDSYTKYLFGKDSVKLLQRFVLICCFLITIIAL